MSFTWCSQYTHVWIISSAIYSVESAIPEYSYVVQYIVAHIVNSCINICVKILGHPPLLSYPSIRGTSVSSWATACRCISGSLTSWLLAEPPPPNEPDPEVDIGTPIARTKMITKSRQPRKNQCCRRSFSPAKTKKNIWMWKFISVYSLGFAMLKGALYFILSGSICTFKPHQ